MKYTVEQLRDHLAACFSRDCCIVGNTTCQQIIDAIDDIVEDRDAKQRGYDDLHEMVGGNGDIWTKVDEILRERNTLAAKLLGAVTLEQLLAEREIASQRTIEAIAAWLDKESQQWAGHPGCKVIGDLADGVRNGAWRKKVP